MQNRDKVEDMISESRVPSATVYDSILNICNKTTKRAYYIPFNKTYTVENFAYIYLRHIYANHGLSNIIISDRDKLFTSIFLKTLYRELGTEQKLSTAFHPQTDGQTERNN